MTRLKVDPPSETLQILYQYIEEETSTVLLKELIEPWMVEQRSAKVLLDHLRTLLLRGDLELVRTPEGTQVNLGCAARDLDYRRRRSDCMSEREFAEFAIAAWSVCA